MSLNSRLINFDDSCVTFIFKNPLNFYNSAHADEHQPIYIKSREKVVVIKSSTRLYNNLH